MKFYNRETEVKIPSEIFENNKEPLYGRADTKILLKPFKAACIKKILVDA